jgi:hypothetical protein
LDNAAWTKSETTVAANLLVSPDGYTNADTVSETTATNQHYAASSAVSFLASTKYTATVFAKWDSSCTRNLHIRLGNCASVNIGASFDKNGNFVNYTGGANGTLDAYSFTNFGNGWLRFSVTITTAATASSGNGIWLYTLQGTAVNFAGSTSQKISYWGAQVEQGAYATSYIPTLAASATRGVDDATKTGITSLIGQTEGTVFLDFEGGANDSVNHFLGLSDGTTSNRVVIVRSSSNTLYTLIRVAGVDQAQIATATLTANTRYKCAVAYKLNDIVFYVNGVQVGTDTTATIPATSVFSTNSGVSSSYFERAINQTLVFKTRLTNAELATLTTI